MKNHGVTQLDLAKELGVTPQAVSLYATGKAGIDLTILSKLSRFFGASTDYLLGMDTNKDTPFDASLYTGLSVDAVKKLHASTQNEKTAYVKDIVSQFTETLADSPLLVSGSLELDIKAHINNGELALYECEDEDGTISNVSILISFKPYKGSKILAVSTRGIIATTSEEEE